VDTLSPVPWLPACVREPGSWCATVYRWTHNDLLAAGADQVVRGFLAITLIVVLALVTRALLHRAIRRLVDGAASGRMRLPTALRRRPGAAETSSAPPSERRVQRAQTIGSVLRSVTSMAILVIAAIMILAEFGLDLAPVLASAGIVGIALGFGAQNLVRDFLSGMFMLLEDQYGVGDIVDLGVASGTVESVGLRITTLRDVEGTVWHVRNGEIMRVGNKTQGYAVAVVDVPLAHTADTARAIELAAKVASDVAADPRVAPDVLEPPEVLGVDRVTVEGVTLRVTVKVSPGRQYPVRRALNAAITEAFDEARMPRPYTAPAAGPAAS
jgi:small conductance mechanosensitive channel